MTNTVYFDPAVGGTGLTVTDDGNPTTGLDNDGHRARFVPALAQVVAVAQHVVDTAQDVNADKLAAQQAVVDAQGHASLASDKAGIATTKAGEAVISASNAAASALSASNSAASASGSATSAASSAVTATTKANEALSSATASNSSAIAAAASATNAANSATNADASADAALLALADAQATIATLGSMLGINFGSFSIVDGEMVVSHLTTTEPSLVDGDLILTYEGL